MTDEEFNKANEAAELSTAETKAKIVDYIRKNINNKEVMNELAYCLILYDEEYRVDAPNFPERL